VPLLRITPESISEAELVELVSANAGLERKLYEYKRELGNGRTSLEAIASMANDVGGLVLIGVDEDVAPGPERLVGVARSEFDRLKDFCVGRLVPPCCPELVAVELAGREEIVIAAFVDPDAARRPVMVDNKIYVRNEAGKTLADWYRLRDLFAEAPAADHATASLSRSVSMMRLYSVAEPEPFLVMRLAVQVQGVRGAKARIRDRGRLALLDALHDAPLTRSGCELALLMYARRPSFGQIGWSSSGENHSSTATFEWALELSGDIRPVEARLKVETTASSAVRPALTLQLDVMFRAFDTQFPERLPFAAVYVVLDEMFATLWGPVGNVATEQFLGVPLGAPALAEFSISGRHNDQPRQLITDLVDFAPARLIADSHGSYGGSFDLVLDRSMLDPEIRHGLMLDWIEELAVSAGLENVHGALTQLIDEANRAAQTQK
jgi:hypothetical protein